MSRRNDPGNPAFRTRARRYINRHFHIIFQRMVYVLLFATIQIAFFVWLFVYMTRLTPLFLVICALLSLLAAMHVINKNSNPAIKIAWLIPLFTLPIFGGLLYLMFGYRRVNRRLTAVTEDIRADYRTAGSNADGQIGGSDDSPVTGAPVPIDEDTVAAQAPAMRHCSPPISRARPAVCRFRAPVRRTIRPAPHCSGICVRHCDPQNAISSSNILSLRRVFSGTRCWTF